MKDFINKKIDDLLNIRQKGMIDYAKATSELVDMGVKIKNTKTGNITLPVSFAPHLKKYNISELEFEWEARYKDGSILKQFDGDKQHNFSNINQTELSSISFVSNFNWPVEAGREARVKVSLDWMTGLFSFQNGFASQQVRAHCSLAQIKEAKKLILVMRRRFSATTGKVASEYEEFFPFEDEEYLYNRFILGFETENVKRAIIINPNGEIEIFDN